MKMNLAKRVMAVVLSGLILVSTVSTYIMRVEAQETEPDTTALLTISKGESTNFTVTNVTVTQEGESVAEKTEQSWQYELQKDVTFKVELVIVAETGYHLKNTVSGENWTVSEGVYSYNLDAGISEDTTLDLTDDIFVEADSIPEPQGTSVTIAVEGQGKIVSNGSAVDTSIVVEENTDFYAIPENGYYVSEVIVGETSETFSKTNIQDDGGYKFSYSYSDTKENDTILVKFAQVQALDVEELSILGVAEESYHKGSDNVFYFKESATLLLTGKSVSTIPNDTAYNFEPSKTISSSYEGNAFFLNKNATSFSDVITGYSLKVIKDTISPVFQESNGSGWNTEKTLTINKNTGDYLTVAGKVTDMDSGIRTAKYYVGTSQPADWKGGDATTIDVQGGAFQFNISKDALESDLNNTKCYLWTEDNCGNTATQEIGVTKDVTEPTIEITIEEKIVKKFFFINKTITNIVVTANDEKGEADTAASGVDVESFKVYLGDVLQTVEATKTGTSKYTITLNDVNLTDNMYIKASVRDKSGNISATANDKHTIRVDQEAPTVTITDDTASNLTRKGDTFYYKNQTTATFTLNISENVGLQSYQISTTGATIEADEQSKVYLNEEDLAGDITLTTTAAIPFVVKDFDDNWDGNVNVTVKDLAGNQTTKIITMKKDAQAPIIDQSQTSVQKTNGITATAIEGAYYIDAKNQTVLIRANIKDNDSGIAKIQLYKNNVLCKEYSTGTTNSDVATYDANTGVVIFKAISLDAGENIFQIVALDNQGNNTGKTDIYATNNNVVYDNDCPSISVSITRDTNTTYLVNSDANPTLYYQSIEELKKTAFQIVSTDEEKLGSVIIKVGESQKTSSALNINTATKTINVDGQTVATWLTDGNADVTIVSTDLAGNSSEKTIHLVLDNAQVSISNVKLSDSTLEIYEKSASEPTTYNSFFHASKVTFTSDVVDEVSGIKSVSYALYDVDNNPVGTTNTFNNSIDIPANFKGTIEITMIDNVGNKRVVKSNGFVVTNSDSTGMSLTPETTDIKDESGNLLYASNTEIKVAVENTYSGIESLTYSVVAPYDTQNNVGDTVVVPDATGWTTEKDSTGMATKLSGAIPVRNNSNGIVVSVRVLDKAGIEKTIKQIVSIDKTAPVITVDYDNNNADSGDKYRENRTATIVVRERNFNAADFKLDVKNAIGGAPTLSGWTDVIDSENPDNSTHTATIIFATDGDYTMNMSYADILSNQGNQVGTQAFTIDKTAPSISVAFDNNTALNNNYYAQGRTATITVVDHCFDPARVTITGTATNDENAVAFPGVGAWTSNGDTHTASISFSSDGDYQFTVNATDQAGNTAAEQQVSEFVVDLTTPTITFGGIENQSAYNGEVMPTVTFEDVNYDINNVNITLVGVNHGEVNYQNGASDSNNGQTFTFTDFEYKSDVDDIYTLTATITDMAGNNFEDSITFSVNRFGSNYELDESLKEIQGKYIQAPIDLVFSEVNVNTLTEGSSKIVVSTNGNPRTLEQGTDYQVQNSGGDGAWSRYTYTIPKDTFASDGTYIVSVYSEDTAGNINENDSEGKNASITFGVDGTAPVISMTNLEENGNYNATSYDAIVNVSDNLLLDDVTIELNGNKVETTVANDSYSFSIPESSDKQTVKVTARDAAGNILSQEFAGIIVTTNALVRIFSNTKVVVGATAGVVAVGGAGVAVGVNGGIGALRFRPKKIKIKK